MAPALEAVYEYYRVFSTLDLAAIAECFCEPCMSVSAAGVITAPNRTELIAAFTPMIEGLKTRGYGRSEFAEAEVTPLGQGAALVRGVAIRYLASGPELERVPIAYLMHRTEAGWKIASMVFPS